MRESIGGPSPNTGRGREIIAGLVLGSFALALAPPTSAHAGPIRHHNPHARRNHVVTTSAVEARENYWQNALKYHWMHVKGPKSLSVLALSPDGTLPATPFAEYMLWRQGLSVKRFDSFHPEVARMLKKIKINHIPPIASPSPPTSDGGPVPILPPDFVPLTPAQEIIPPQIPEPSSGLTALAMIGGAVLARRWARRSRM